MQTIEELIRRTEALTYLNSLKTCLIELKDEFTVIKDTQVYQDQAIERAIKLMRRIDNQYRAIVKAAHGQEVRDEIDVEVGIVNLMEAAPNE